MTKTAEKRFWDKVEKTETCWNWTASKRRGYGACWTGSKLVPAHRYSFELANGAIPYGKHLDHICHNRGCVNPEHLRAVTPKQNHENRNGADFNSTSGIRGVHVCSRSSKWAVRVGHNGKIHNGGLFADLEEAEAAAIALRNSLFTHNDADKKAA